MGVWRRCESVHICGHGVSLIAVVRLLSGRADSPKDALQHDLPLDGLAVENQGRAQATGLNTDQSVPAGGRGGGLVGKPTRGLSCWTTRAIRSRSACTPAA